MCAWEESLLWLLCGGKYKLLLRSAWIVISITTVIDICAITAYWHLAPEAGGSRPGLKLSLLLIIAVLFLYFFACFISGFVILQLSGKKYRSESESITLNSNRPRYRPTARFISLPQTPHSHSNGFRYVLQNNAPISLPSGNSQRTNLTEEQNRHINTGHNTARLNTRNGKFYTSPKNLNLCDKHDKRHNTQTDNAVPEIIISRPENSAPNYEITVPQTSQFSARSQGKSRTNAAYQNMAPNSVPNYEITKPKASQFSTRSQSNSCTNVAFQNMAPNSAQNYYASGIKPSSVARPTLKRCQTYQPSVSSRSIDLKAKPLCSRSESCASRPLSTIDAKRTSELSMNQAKLDSRMVNSNPSIGPGVSSQLISSFGTSEQYKRRSITITGSSDSFLAKSEPVVHQYRKCIVDKLPATANPQTLMLFKAITRSAHLFELQSKDQASSNISATNRLSEVVNV